MLALALAGEEVAAVEDLARLDADPGEGRAGELDDVLPGEDVGEVDAARRRHLLEERILVVPGPQVGGLAAEALGEPRVGRLLPASRRRRR